MARQAPRGNQYCVKSQLEFGVFGMRHQPGLRCGDDALLLARASLDEAAYAVTARQQQRIIATAQAWLMAHSEHADFELRFDAILIAPRRLPRHLLAAFDAST
jgi:hypothetical protein